MADIYIANAALGTDSGADASNAHSKAWFNTADNWGNGAGTIMPGDTVHIVGILSEVAEAENCLVIQSSGSEESPITIFFEDGAKITAPFWGGANTEGGAIFLEEKDYIIIDGGANGVIECTDTGTLLSYQAGGVGSSNHAINCRSCDVVEIKNLSLNNLYVAVNEAGSGFSGTHGYAWAIEIYEGSVTVHDCSVEYAGVGFHFSVGSSSVHEIYNCTADKISVGIMATGYGNTSIKIHHNQVTDTSMWGYNDGMKFFNDENVSNIMYGLEIDHNIVGPKCWNTASTAAFLVDQGHYDSPKIHHNLIIGDASDNPANAYITVGGHTLYTDPFEMAAEIYNNTIVSAYAGTDIAILVTKHTTGHKIYNNIISYPSSGSVSVHFLMFNDEDCELDDSDYNCFYTTGTTEIDGNSLTDWTTASGLDSHSIDVDPNLDERYRPTSDSSVIDAGKTLDVGYSNTDLLGVIVPVGSGWDIGAYEYGTTVGTNYGGNIMGWLKQSTAVTLKMGPFVDSTDGNTAETELTIQKANVRLSKNGGDMAAANADQGVADAGAAYDETSNYDISLDTTDTNTLGALKVAIHMSGALYVGKTFMVVPANVYDSLILGTDYIDSATAEMAANVLTAAVINADAITNAKIADDAIGAEHFAAGAIDANALAADAVDEFWDELMETGVTGRNALRALIGFIAGKTSGGGTTSITFRDYNDSLDIIAQTVDGDGDRSATTLTFS